MPFLTPNASGELETHKTFILQQLAQIRTTVFGLSDEQAHATPTASSLNLSGLLLHAAEVALFWTAAAMSAPHPPRLPHGFDEDHPPEQLVTDPRPLSEVLSFFDRLVGLASENLDQIADLSALVPVPDTPWIPEGLTHWEARWCLHHIGTEIARHAGHADIIRETIDGKISYELNDLADGVG